MLRDCPVIFAIAQQSLIREQKRQQPLCRATSLEPLVPTEKPAVYCWLYGSSLLSAPLPERFCCEHPTLDDAMHNRRALSSYFFAGVIAVPVVSSGSAHCCASLWHFFTDLSSRFISSPVPSLLLVEREALHAEVCCNAGGVEHTYIFVLNVRRESPDLALCSGLRRMISIVESNCAFLLRSINDQCRVLFVDKFVGRIRSIYGGASGGAGACAETVGGCEMCGLDFIIGGEFNMS